MHAAVAGLEVGTNEVCCVPDEIIWPCEDEALPPEAQDLISRLLRQNPRDRLGTGKIATFDAHGGSDQLSLSRWGQWVHERMK